MALAIAKNIIAKQLSAIAYTIVAGLRLARDEKARHRPMLAQSKLASTNPPAIQIVPFVRFGICWGTEHTNVSCKLFLNRYTTNSLLKYFGSSNPPQRSIYILA